MDKVLHRAKLQSSDVHSDSETATSIVNECISDAEAEINSLTRHSDGWDPSEDYYASIQTVATDLAASYLFQQDIAAKAVGRSSEEFLKEHNWPPGNSQTILKAFTNDEENDELQPQVFKAQIRTLKNNLLSHDAKAEKTIEVSEKELQSR